MRKTEFVKRLEGGKISPLSEGYMKCMKDPSIINLGTAENKLIGDKILPLVQNRSYLTEKDLTYPASSNTTLMNEAIAALFRDHFGIQDAKGDQIITGSGISGLIETIGLALCEPNEIVLLPIPTYPGFINDLKMCSVKLEFIDLENLPSKPPENSRILLLTNPGNPIGDLIPNPEIILKWAYQNPNLHIITDDIYALTTRNGKPFQSIAGLDIVDPERVHLLYGLAKDWALAGFHIGFFWSRNYELLKMVKTANGMYSISSDMVSFLTNLFSNFKLRDEIILTSQNRLIESEKITKEYLLKYNINFKSFDATLYLMIDLIDLCEGNEEGELKIFRKLIDEYKVMILPGGSGFKCPKFGWFRLCFSIPNDQLIEGLTRLGNGITELRKHF